MPVRPSPLSPSRTIQIRPMPVNPMASQVRSGTDSRSTSMPSNAASSGDAAITTSTLATLVNVRAIMKQVNITAHINPESHPRLPPDRVRESHCPRCMTIIVTMTKAAQKSDRQKAISKPSERSRKRVPTPAVLHKSVQPSIVRRARWCVRRAAGRDRTIGSVGRPASSGSVIHGRRGSGAAV